jgi:hypothetical protein
VNHGTPRWSKDAFTITDQQHAGRKLICFFHVVRYGHSLALAVSVIEKHLAASSSERAKVDQEPQEFSFHLYLSTRVNSAIHRLCVEEGERVFA